MNKENTSKIIKNLRNAGLNNDADALQKAIDGAYDNTYNGIKIAQLEETPFTPARKKLRVYEPQLDKEKAWLRTRLPMSGQHREKLFKDPRVQGEAAALGGEEALGYGMPYRDPASISRTSDPDAMIERIRERGWPPQGLTTPHGRVLDVDPKHPVTEIGPRGGKTYGEEFDFGEGAGIGFIPEGGEYDYQQQENLDPGLVEMIQKIWGEGRMQFAVNVDMAMERFNDRLEHWMTDDKNQMLATNFMTQINQVVTGNRNTNSVFEANLHGENLAAVIIKRRQHVEKIKNDAINKANESGEYSKLQTSLYTQYIDDLNSGKDYPSERWLNKLMLVYGQDPRKGREAKDYIMDIIADNPLKIKYPQSFIENIVLPYDETKRKAAEKSEGGQNQNPLMWEDILSRNFRPITTGAEETASRRKMIEDVDIWKGLMSGGKEGKPLITSQKDIIVYNYDQELMHLFELLKDLQRMLNIRSKFSSGGLEDAAQNPNAVEEMHNAVVKFARTLEQHYKQGEITTLEGKLMGNYSVGSETKLEIYLKSLYILQAYEAWSEGLGRKQLTQEPIEEVMGEKEPPMLRDIEKIEADESMIPKSAFSYADMVKIANALDSYGMVDLADQIELMWMLPS